MHTRTPWTHDFDDGHIFGQGCRVATLNTLIPEYRANADLITAAPNMAEVLRCIAELDENWTEYDQFTLGCTISEYKAAARAALPKRRDA
jgi:hypothetical protein